LRPSSKSLQRWAVIFTHNQPLAPKRRSARGASVEAVFERLGVSFVSVTQQFNTTTSVGRLMLNVLLSFAQFGREVSRLTKG